jgi:ubiquinone/menaquinone biosynthesis C-methylase UbiE
VQRLAGAREHLDGELSDPRVLAGNLRDLRRVNRFFGGLDLSRRALEVVVDARGPERASTSAGRTPGSLLDEPVTLLDIGTGGADIPIALIEAFRRRGRRLTIMAVDSRPEVLEAAAAARSAIGASVGLTLRVADGLTLPFEAGSFDVAHASLVLHHLEPAEAETLVREMARVARHGVILNDLARGWLPWLGAWLVIHLTTRNAFTRHDGPLSVRRAYSPSEARTLLTNAGLRIVHEEKAIAGHRWAIAAVHA